MQAAIFLTPDMDGEHFTSLKICNLNFVGELYMGLILDVGLINYL